jgi:hypothetical protein
MKTFRNISFLVLATSVVIGRQATLGADGAEFCQLYSGNCYVEGIQFGHDANPGPEECTDAYPDYCSDASYECTDHCWDWCTSREYLTCNDSGSECSMYCQCWPIEIDETYCEYCPWSPAC